MADAIHRRVISLSLEELGPAPCEFAFIVMGSLGRKEQTLATDQDNAIIIDECPEADSQEAKDYFLSLGKKINASLSAIGYQTCPGDIMAGNPKWNQGLHRWKKYFSGWIRDSEPKDILDVAIFFDFRCLYGDESIVESLREHVIRTAQSWSVFFFHMAQSVMKMKPPLNFFGNIKSDSNTDELTLDIKKLLLPVTSYLRLYAIREGLTVTGSMERNQHLQDRKVLDASVFEELEQSFNYLTYLRIKGQSKSITHNEIPGNSISFNQLSRIEIAILKKLIADISNLQTRLGSAFGPPQG